MQKQMIKKQFNNFSEQGILKEVILGNPFSFVEGEKINEAMRKYYGTSKTPKKEKIIQEYQLLEKILHKNNITVYYPSSSEKVPQQLAPRDIGFVIGNTFVVSNMKWQSRKCEIDSIQTIIKLFEGEILQIPKDVVLEGGNILINNSCIFVGIGLRTSENAVSFLIQHFPNFKIRPVYLNEKEEIIHLDAVLNFVSKDYIIIYPSGIKNYSEIINNFKIFSITTEEMKKGACNFISINSRKIIIRDGLPRIESILKNMGKECYKIDWSETKKTGTVGPRCATLPLVRID